VLCLILYIIKECFTETFDPPDVFGICDLESCFFFLIITSITAIKVNPMWQLLANSSLNVGYSEIGSVIRHALQMVE
jgi:hypothetical protein